MTLRRTMGHEDFTPKTTIKASSERAFGLVFAAVFAIVALYPLISHAPVRWWSVAVAAAFAVAAFAAPKALAPLNRLWMRLGALLHKIVSPIVLGFMFFLVITPTGWLMRLFRKDPLRLRFDGDAKSYWIERSPPGPPPETFRDQF